MRQLYTRLVEVLAKGQIRNRRPSNGAEKVRFAGIMRLTCLMACLYLQLGFLPLGYAKVIYRCHMCGMDAAKSQTEFIADLNDGGQEHMCCLHCVYLLGEFMPGRKITKLETRDFTTGGLTDAGRAYYLEQSSLIPKKSMAPFLLAFSGREVAEKYQKKYGGNIVDFTKAMKIVARFDEEVASHGIGTDPDDT